MKIKLKSKLFKRLFKRVSVEIDDLEHWRFIEIAGNENLVLTKDLDEYKKILADYESIVKYLKPSSIEFINLSDELIRDLLNIGFPETSPGLKLKMSNIKSKDSSKIQLKGIADKDIEVLELDKFEGLDLDLFFADISFPESLKCLTIYGDLPSAVQIERFKNIRELKIEGIKDSMKLFNFLEAVQLENLSQLSLIDCNLENMPEILITRLTSLKLLNLSKNENIDYSKILKNIPNKDLLEELFLEDSEGSNFKFDIKNLAEYTKLEGLSFSNFDIEFDELSAYLEKLHKLNDLKLFNANVKNLDFLLKLNNIRLDVYIEQNDIDFAMLTPKVAHKYRKIILKKNRTEEEVSTFLLPIDFKLRKFKLGYHLDVKSNTLLEFENIILDVDGIGENGYVISTESATVVDALYGEVNIDLSGNTFPIEEMLLKISKKFEMCNGYSITVSSFSELDEEMCSRLNKNGKLEYIYVMDSECDKACADRFKYTPEQYIELKKKIKEITADIPDNLTELQKFMIIYRRLGTKVAYDHDIVGDNEFSQHAKNNKDTSRNCVNGLLKRKCVCAGYADILYNCLREVGIETYKIEGIGNNGYHQWNKVKLDGVFYNVDLTWDTLMLSCNFINDLEYCLRSDEFFVKNHKVVTGNNVECPKDYDRSKIVEALRFAMDFDCIKDKNNYKERGIKKIFFINAFEIVMKKVNELFKMFIHKNTKLLPQPNYESGLKKSKTISQTELASSQTSSWDLGTNGGEVKMEVEKICGTPVVISGDMLNGVKDDILDNGRGEL